LSQQYGVSKANDFALLREIGGECAGAVSLVFEDKPTKQSPQKPIAWLSQTELSELIKTLPQRPMLAGQDGLRLSLAGAQNKLPVTLKPNSSNELFGIGRPEVGIPSTHIIKPSITGLMDTAHNEMFCMSLAKHMRINTPTTLFAFVNEWPIFIIERYDRVQSNGQPLARLHQEDFCQALGVSTDNKYQAEGGPSLADCFRLVRQATHNSATSVISLLDYVIFNTLVGNHDAHGKNFSLLYRSAKVELSPLYDCLSTAVYPTLTPKMAMSIGGKYLFSQVHARHWEQFAMEAGLSNALTKQRVLFFAKNLGVEARKARALGQNSAFDSPIVEGICQLIEQRCALTLKRLS
jgi:serine/threonine-protein kinase HipA